VTRKWSSLGEKTGYLFCFFNFLVRYLSTAGYSARPTNGPTAGLNQKAEGNTIRSFNNIKSSFPRCQITSRLILAQLKESI
jgi:hypothetical protein